MLPISAREPVRFTPDHYRDEDGAVPAGAPVYLIAVPTLRGKAEFNRACVAAGLVTHDRAAMIATLREGVAAQIEEDQAGPLLDMLDRIEAAGAGSGGDGSGAEPDPRDLEDFVVLQNDMRRHWPKYAAMVADGVHYQQMAPVIAAQIFLAGWEEIEAPFLRRNGQVGEELLCLLPEEDVIAIGIRALALFAPSEAEAKNSGSRSPSRGGRRNSAGKRRKGTPGSCSASDTSATPPADSAATTG